MSYNPSQHKNYDMTEAKMDDRVTALEQGAKSLDDRVDKLEEDPKVPMLPTANGQYLLTVTSGSGSSKVVSWQPIELPPLPSEGGSYVLKVTVDGTTVSYSWTASEEK